jgi:hypothetical protein
MLEITIRQAITDLHILGYPATPCQARRNLSNWLAHGLVRGRKVQLSVYGDNNPMWLIDEDELLAAWREGRIPPKVGRP